MRSLNARDALSVVAVIGALTFTARPASADDKLACNTAYDQTQTLRRDGRLQAARIEALVCLRDVCAEFVRADCARWLGAIEAAQPSLVFEVLDRKGNATSSVRISLDGQPWLSDLDGKSRPIDPGQHVVRLEIDGAAPIEQTLQIVEGDRNRKISTSFALPVTSSEIKPIYRANPPSSPRGTPLWAWVSAASGLAVGGLSIGFAAASVGQASSWHEVCPNGKCPLNLTRQQEVTVASESQKQQTDGVLAGVTGVIGAVALGVGIYGIASTSKKGSTFDARFVFLPGGGRWEGTF